MTTQSVDDTFLPRRGEKISPVEQAANNEAVLTNDNPTIPRVKVDEREVDEREVDEPTPEPTLDAADEISQLHEESERLLAVIDRPLGFPSHRRKLQAALQAEGDALRKAGFHSYTEFLIGTAPSTVLESFSPDPPVEAEPAVREQPEEPFEVDGDPDAPEPVLENERVSSLEADLIDARAGREAASAEIAISKSEIRRLASELELARSDLATALAPPPPPLAAVAPANDRRVGLESDLFALEQRLMRTRAKRQRIRDEIADERRHLGRERQAADQEVALARRTVERLRRSSELEAKAVEDQAETIALALTEAAIDEADAIVAIATSEANRRRQLADGHAGRATRKIETVKARLELLRFETIELSRVLSEMLAEIVTDLGPTDKRDD